MTIGATILYKFIILKQILAGFDDILYLQISWNILEL